MMQKSDIFLILCGATMAVIAVYMVFEGVDAAKIIAPFAGAIAMAGPAVIDRWLSVRLPVWLKVWFGLFILGSLLFGTTFDMYSRWWPWDSLLHLLSGTLVAGFGMVLLHQRFGKLKVVLPIWGRIVLIGMFSSTVAFLWEVAEFLSDNFLGTMSQNNSVTDTMMDMILGTATGVITAVVYYGIISLKRTNKTKQER